MGAHRLAHHTARLHVHVQAVVIRQRNENNQVPESSTLALCRHALNFKGFLKERQWI